MHAIYISFTGITALLGLLFGLRVYTAGKDQIVNRIFALFALIFSVWVCFDFLAYQTSLADFQLIINRIIFFLICFLVLTLAWFVDVFPRPLFIIPKIILKNTSDTSFEFIPFLFLHVKDSQGNVYPSVAIPSEGRQFSGILVAGDVLQEEVGFEVPKNATGLTLFLETGSQAGNKIIAISLEGSQSWLPWK